MRRGADEAFALRQHLREFLFAEADALVAGQTGKEIGITAVAQGLGRRERVLFDRRVGGLAAGTDLHRLH